MAPGDVILPRKLNIMQSATKYLDRIPRELKLFALASLAMGVSYSVFDSTFNNFLNDRFMLKEFERTFLEFPRELPGILAVFVTAAVWFLCSRRLGAVSMFLGAAGAILIGFSSSSYSVMVFWLFIYSLGQHLFMPLASGIGMELSSAGKTGQRLGQLNALRNIATIFGSFLVFIGFRYLNFTFEHSFVLIAVGLGTAGVLMTLMRPQKTQRAGNYFKLHREYKLYYLLAILFGSRKQLFITFAPWVLVSVLGQPTQLIATLMTIGGVIGILFQPFLGWMIDHWGERLVLAGEAALLIVVCFGYGFAQNLFAERAAFLVICACYLLDQMLMSVNMARATFMKKIALRPEDIQPALTSAVTIDHVFSISIALIGGLIWRTFGYQYVFLMGVGIALINLLVALQIRLPGGDAQVVAEPLQAAQGTATD